MANLYEKLASDIEEQIQNGVMKIGDKLPSVRSLHKKTGWSVTTVLQAMYLLEKKGLIIAKPKIGYFVSFSRKAGNTKPVISTPLLEEAEKDVAGLIQKVYIDPIETDIPIVNFSMGAPAPEMLPFKKLKKLMQELSRSESNIGLQYGAIIGNESLRREVAKRTLLWERSLKAEELIGTHGCMSALSYALMSTTQRGNTILVESPVYFGTLQLAKSMGLNVVEMPTHSQLGLDLDAVRHKIQGEKISACIVVSNFSNPMGYCMPEAHKRLLVELCTHYNVPLIEEDLYGDVYFGKERPLSCKSIDEAGIVLWCNSVSKTLAPGYRVGWLSAGRYHNKALQSKLFHDVTSNALTHELIARFIETGRYDHHLRQLRIGLTHNLARYLQIIQEYFPKGTKTSHPEGGFMLWLELPPQINCTQHYKEALLHGIKYTPGRIFTLRDQFHNCIRLSYGLLWNRDTELALMKLGRFFKEQLA